MAKFKLESALDMIPDLKTSMEHIGEEGFDIPDIYQGLRIAEEGYEALLQETEKYTVNSDRIESKLREKRYQIAELACRLMFTDLENLYASIKNRSVDTGVIGDSFAGIANNDYLPKLKEYLTKLVPNLEDEVRISKVISEKNGELFPEEEEND